MFGALSASSYSSDNTQASLSPKSTSTYDKVITTVPSKGLIQDYSSTDTTGSKEMHSKEVINKPASQSSYLVTNSVKQEATSIESSNTVTDKIENIQMEKGFDENEVQVSNEQEDDNLNLEINRYYDESNIENQDADQQVKQVIQDSKIEEQAEEANGNVGEEFSGNQDEYDVDAKQVDHEDVEARAYAVLKNDFYNSENVLQESLTNTDEGSNVTVEENEYQNLGDSNENMENILKEPFISLDEEYNLNTDEVEQNLLEELEEEQNSQKKQQRMPVSKPMKQSQIYTYRQTTFGQQCLFPFTLENETYTDCMVAKDKNEYCMIDGIMYECDPSNDKANTNKKFPRRPAKAEIRFTKSGLRCRLPIMIRDKWMVDCLFISGARQVCLAEGKWQYCQPKEPQNKQKQSDSKQTVIRFTTNGEQCQFPFMYDNKQRRNCVKMSDQNEWCKIGFVWRQCLGDEKASLLRLSQMMDYQTSDSYMDQYSTDQQGNKGGNQATVAILGVVVAVVVVGIIGLSLAICSTKNRITELSKMAKKSNRTAMTMRR